MDIKKGTINGDKTQERVVSNNKNFVNISFWLQGRLLRLDKNRNNKEFGINI